MRKKKRSVNVIGFELNYPQIPTIIKKQAKKNKSIIYGARAMNRQLPGMFQRRTGDWDVLSKKPKRSANALQRKLDKRVAGQDDFYMKRAEHKGTWKVLWEGIDGRQRTEDDLNIADYSPMPVPRPKTYGRGHLKYQRISDIVKRKKQILKDKASKYRHRKDRGDLSRIRNYRRLRRVR